MHETTFFLDAYDRFCHIIDRAALSLGRLHRGGLGRFDPECRPCESIGAFRHERR
jgi:hypothetical protein